MDTAAMAMDTLVTMGTMDRVDMDMVSTAMARGALRLMRTMLPMAMATIPMPTPTKSDLASTLTTLEDEQLRLTLITDTMATDIVMGMGMVMATMFESEICQIRIER